MFGLYQNLKHDGIIPHPFLRLTRPRFLLFPHAVEPGSVDAAVCQHQDQEKAPD